MTSRRSSILTVARYDALTSVAQDYDARLEKATPHIRRALVADGLATRGEDGRFAVTPLGAAALDATKKAHGKK